MLKSQISYAMVTSNGMQPGLIMINIQAALCRIVYPSVGTAVVFH